MQYKKNVFNFVILIVTVGLGLSLMLSGCGESGSTTPNPLNGSTSTASPTESPTSPTPPTPSPPSPIPPSPTPPSPTPPTPPPTNQVIFDYNILPAGTIAEIGISADIAKVRYAFYYTDEQQNVLVDIQDTYTYDFEHKDQAYQKQVPIANVTTEPTKVTAAYYDTEGELVALGVNELQWDQTTKNANVTNPQVWHLGDDPNVSLEVSDYIIPKDGQTVLTLKITPAGKEAVDMTAFARFEDINENVLASVDKQPGRYTGINYSNNEGEKPALYIGTKFKAVDKAIFVTDQEIASIKLTPAPIEGKAITVKDNSFRMFYTDDKNKLADQNVLHMTNVGNEKDTYTAAVNEQPMQVWAAYGTVSDKGPTPPDIDITDDNDVTISHQYKASATDYMEVKDKVVIHINGENSTGSNEYAVSAQWKEFNSDPLTVTLADTFNEAYLYFVNRDTGALIIDEIQYSGAGVDTYNMRLAAGIMSLDGKSYSFYRSEMVDIPIAWIGQGQYPKVIPVVTSPTGVSKYEQDNQGVNSYTLEVSGKPAAEVELKIERPAGATYPDLHETSVVP